MNSAGRPSKYQVIVATLDPCEIYSAASIAWWVYRQKKFPASLKDEKDRLRLRIALGQMRQNKLHLFPKGGDGSVQLPGQVPTPAWLGWRWQKAYHIKTEEDI